MSHARTVAITMSHPDDGTENYDRDIELMVRCTPRSPMHWPSPSCETGCPEEPAEFEILSGIFLDDKMPVSEAALEKLDVSRVEELAAEAATPIEREYQVDA